MGKRNVRVLVGVWLVLVVGACAAPRLAEAPIDWMDADQRWSILVVTTDPDGDDRVTRIWLAMMDGHAVFRTNDSQWWSNLQREPRLRVRHDGADHAFDVEFVDEEAGRIAIDGAFREKYGWMEALMFPQPAGRTHENYGRLAAP